MCKPELYLNSEIQAMTMENTSCKSTDVPKQVMCIPGDNTFYMTESVFGYKEMYLIIEEEQHAIPGLYEEEQHAIPGLQKPWSPAVKCN